MANSVNTNIGAMAALQSLRVTQSNLETKSKVVQTGYRVADAMDDASTFSVAQGIRGNLQAYQAVRNSLANGLGLGDVTRTALEKMTDAINLTRAKVVALADDSISAQQRAIYIADFQQLAGQIPNYINQANYNGVNLMSNGSVTRTFLADVGASQLQLTSQSSLWTAWTTFTVSHNVTTAANATAALTPLQTLSDAITNSLATVAAESRQLRLQANYVNDIMDANTTGLGAIVDGDMGKAAAGVQAEQVKRELAVNSLSIANQQPSAILGFLR
jgi:flagellin